MRCFSSDFYGNYDNVMRIYGFNTENYPYTVELRYDEFEDYDENTTNILGVRFFTPDDEDPDIERDDVVTNKGELFRVMATVTAIIKKDLKDHPEVDTITFTPSKKEGETTNISRLNLYTKYIRNFYPNATITSGKRGIEIKFK